MRKYKEIRAEVVAQMSPLLEEPQKKVTYFSYLNGIPQEHDSLKEALFRSKTTETVVTNRQEIENFRNQCREIESRTLEVWHAELRQEHEELTDEQYKLCYQKAWEDGHSYGCDEVVLHMDDVVDFANRLLSTVK